MNSFELFSREEDSNLTPENAPLAERMRPKSLDEVAGQEHLLGANKILRRTMQANRLISAILYGPPGCGKTTLARLISKDSKAVFVAINAVTSNVPELRKIIDEARRQRGKNRTVLFIDEIHRFNKAQQDVLMPDVENGSVILIGATTHNPSFSINGPLLSRALILELHPLTPECLIRIMDRALKDKDRGLGHYPIKVEKGFMEYVAECSSGDARRALNALEVGALTTPRDQEGIIRLDLDSAKECCQKKIVHYDHDEDYHYDTISAFIKSMRGSDPDAAVYWLAKMLYAGEDPRFIVRRILIFASEDIGNADPNALILAQAGLQAIEFVGMPEAQITLAHLVTYMACSVKSNASYVAIQRATQDIKEGKTLEVPQHLRDSHYPGAKGMNHGTGYKYPHDYAGNYVSQEYLSGKRSYYTPSQNGYEKKFFDHLARLRQSNSKPPDNRS